MRGMTTFIVGVVLVVGVVAIVLVLRRPKADSPKTLRARGRKRRQDSSTSLHYIDENETEDERRLRKLRELQRSEKIREAEEEMARSRHAIEDVEVELDEEALRLQKIREFQRAEKIREAQEELELHGPEVVPEPTLGKLITHRVMEMKHEEQQYKDERNAAEVNRVVAEGRDLINDMNRQFGWRMGEPSIPDRLFNTDVETVLGTAISRGTVDYRTYNMLAVMRSYARASTGGRNELAEVMAARVIMGSARLTEEESRDINGSKRLFGDDFAEAEGFADQMSRSQELIESRQLGLNAPAPTTHDYGIDHDFDRKT